MKSTIELLSPTDRKALALFYGTPAYAALERLVKLERLELAKDAIEQTDILIVRYLHGGSVNLQKILRTVKDIHKSTEKGS